jgi:hypothetical protein
MSKSTLVAAIVVLATLVLALALNPSPDQHRAALKEVTAQRSPIAGALGIGALRAFTSTYHSVGVASYTTVNDRVASVGALGMVFVTESSSDK